MLVNFYFVQALFAHVSDKDLGLLLLEVFSKLLSLRVFDVEKTTPCKPDPLVDNASNVGQLDFAGDILVVRANILEGVLSH